MTTVRTHARLRFVLACIACAFAACAGRLDAQYAKPKYDEKVLFRETSTVTAGAAVYSWNIGDGVRIAQQTYPMTVTIPATERILCSMTAIPASVRQGEAAIGGVAETRFGVSAVMPGDKWWVTGSVSLPTGATKLSNEQTAIAAALAQPALEYAMPSMGHGFNTTLGCAYASSVARGIVFGFGAAASFKGTYEPLAPAGQYSMRYEPGTEIAANIGVDLRDGLKTNRLSADYTVTYYVADRINGEKIFKPGIRAAFVVVGSHTSPLGVHTLQLRAELHAHNVNIIDGREETSSAAQLYDLQYALTLPLGGKTSLTAAAEARAMSSDEFPVNGAVLATGGGTVGSVSADCRYAVAPWCTASAQAGFGVGSITLMNRGRHAVGFGAGAGLKFSF